LYQHLNETTEALLQEGKSVIYDANLNRKLHRHEKYQLAEKLGANVQLFYVQTDQALAKQRRVSEATARLIPKHETSEQMFERIAKIIEPPAEDEPFISLDGTKITNQYISEKLA
jgi:predicted kinase